MSLKQTLLEGYKQKKKNKELEEKIKELEDEC